MKTLIFIFVLAILIASSLKTFAQNSDVNLDGEIFTGTLTENTPPDVDRMPIVLNETIRFVNGKIFSDALEMYLSEECNYTAFVDDRRMIAMKVVMFEGNGIGTSESESITVKYSGSIIGENDLTGNLTVLYPGGREINFIVSAKKN